MRFCTVPRATPRALASDATEARASLRSRPIRVRSVSSMAATPTKKVPSLSKTAIYHDVLFIKLVNMVKFLSLFWFSFGRRWSLSPMAFRAPGPQRRFIMVDFIGVERVTELVARRGAACFIEELAAQIQADFLRWDAFDKSPRHATHSSVGVIELMPTSDGQLYAFKYVNGHPSNTALGLLTVTAFGVLSDVRTGYPLLLSELTLTTALRTAATSALAARRMARPDSRVMALIGNGAQSEFQAIAFHHMLGIRELRLYDTDP